MECYELNVLIGERVFQIASTLASAYCQSCGSPLVPGATFCQKCGAPVEPRVSTDQPALSATAGPTGQPTPVISPTRPGGVVILTVLQALAGIVVLLFGFLFILGAIFAPIVAILGIPILILGLIGLYIAWGLYRGKDWARILAMITAVIFVVIGLILLIVIIGIVPLALGVLVLYYLTRPEVKSYYRAN